jgi:hypothetical protein
MFELTVILSWGSPIGIGLFLFLLMSGMGIFFWGVSKFPSVK